MKTERFKTIRVSELKKVFNSSMPGIWRSIVKDQLRGLEIKDIYDYYDFNFNIEERSESIKNKILEGEYKSSQPLIFKVEKKMGICRHLIIPQPMDALVMQTITEYIYESIIKSQPSKNSFYSRDRHSIGLPHHVDTDGEYDKDWRKLWKKMQKTIFGFNKSKKFILVTDLTNYFDSIDLTTLREYIVGRVGDEKKEVLIDLLFRIIEEISWKPDYLPYKKHGLPTINIESIRLLGHTFLFELDEVLKSDTDNSFARWMDDITIAVDSKKDAAAILNGVSDVLKSRGLALNLSKTKFFNSKDFEYNFLIKSNLYLDSLSSKVSLNKKEINKLKNTFIKHLEDTEPLHWAKVTKRFITAFSKYHIDILKYIEKLYIDSPNVRKNLCLYLENYNYSKKSSRIIEKILKKIEVHDDVSMFMLAKVITDWNIPENKDSKKFLQKVYYNITDISDPMGFYCILWIRSKYDHPDTLLNFIIKYENIWRKNSFTRRQVVGSLSRVFMFDKSKVLNILNSEVQSGIVDTVSIASHIIQSSEIKSLESKVLFYLFPKKLKKYSLQRFLVLCSFLNSEEIRKNEQILKVVKKYITDFYQKKWLEVSYNINF